MIGRKLSGGILIIILLAVASVAQAVTYQYDTQNRLTRTRFDDGTVVEYTYDKAGNRHTKVLGVSDNHPPVVKTRQW